MPSRYTRMALIYDFDGTLASGNMQEGMFIPNLGMTKKEFWAEVNRIAKEHQADNVLAYMHLMLKKASERKVPVRLKDFKELGKSISLFKGVEDWFGNIDSYSQGMGIRNEHYIVSSGNAEIIEGSCIASKFKGIYASRFMFNENDVAMWPAQAINFTTKTQFLFRINKDAHDLSDEKEVNKYVPKNQRPVPFENMVYFGDGATDIPCFRLVKEEGGLSIAVFKPNTRGAREKALQLLTDGRVHHITPADYQKGSDLDKVVKAQIDYVAAREVRTRKLSVL